MQPGINLREHGTQVKCENCGNDSFEESFFLFKISKILTGESSDSLVPVPTFKCAKCGHINDEYNVSKKNEPEEKKPSSLII